ncbi:hypothetical protein [Sinorhizobium medicae]|uniref:hypothetical protein n=1 Tax=Sinorhizobium medicae TaxID=110321 RepID=UPI000FDB3A9B|nr:hypothetical protein [Sinorhizobium medicae]RVP48130.1 hypothetical protein CN078_25645 [Sinorhizobium medicae]RVP75417.1 hypothetical protein CN079_19965 [Sinorhizobium medicae]UWU06609.1 hypothetical protein N2598_09445 [Sinorhizobium medicae]
MSSIKEYMHEIWSQHDAEINFLCPDCGHPASAFLKIPGDQDEHFEGVSCLNNEDPHDWTVIIRHDDLNGFSAELEEDPEVDVTIDVGGNAYDDWDEPEPEPDAYGIFRRAMADWKSNVRELSTPFGASGRNRMLFVTLYSILEAFLSDAIIGAAMEDVAVQRKMLKLDGLKDKQVSLDTILDKPDIVREMVKTTLQGLSFHKLGPINGICESCFGKPILPRDKDDRALVMKSIDKRHDCVHRNGVDKEGTVHEDITREYLEKIGGIFDEIAKALDYAMRLVQAEKFFEDPDKKEAEGK